MGTGLYETDFYRWSVEQAQLLELGRFDGLDLVNLADEIGSLGREEARSLERHFAELIGNLLKWEYAFQWRNKIWRFNITSKRREIRRLLILTFTANGFNSHQGVDILPMLEIFEDWQLSVQDVFNLLKFS